MWRPIKGYFKSGQVSLPTMFVIDRNGHMADQIVGFSPKALEKSLLKVLK
ncbi:MAG: hypothetical protein LJE96_01950 [Deltaproteobacteria bacterium]|nr:hypothetical protein [Deltaproteobacteria bacterium]